VSIIGRHGSEASRDTTFLRNSESFTVVRGGIFLVALANACRIFARVTMPTSLFPSTMGTRLIRLRSSIAAMSPSDVSGWAVMTSRVITSATLRECDLMYSVADAHSVDINSSHQECRLVVPISGRRIRSPSLTMPTSSPFLPTSRRPTDVIVQQCGGDFADARVNAHRNDVGNHHICSLHDGVLLSH